MLVSPVEDGARGRTAEEVRIALESPLPASLPPHTASAVFCSGVCFHPEHDVELGLLIDGRRHRPTAVRMPRPDVLAGDGRRRSYRSGWWATVPVRAPAAGGRVEVAAAVRIAGGGEERVGLGAIEVAAEPPPAPSPALPDEAIAICMGTFNPDLELFAAQLDSIRAQTDPRWICVISDDCSDPGHFERILEVVDEDARFIVARSERRLGFYRNFERALRMVSPGVGLVALCDQDDRWQPQKLERLRHALGDAGLVYSDQRLVDRSGRVLRETMWRGRRNNHTNLASLLIANTITGASTLFRREVAELALPFPDTPGLQFHDHWLALVALAAGEVRYVPEPLYDYVQHAGAVFGEVTSAVTRRSQIPRERRWRAAYFCGWLSREVQAQALLARCGQRLEPRKRRALERFISSQRSLVSFGWLLLRPARRLIGASETLGSELDLIPGIIWRWWVAVCASVSPRRRCDATYPDPLDFEQTRLRRWRARV